MVANQKYLKWYIIIQFSNMYVTNCSFQIHLTGKTAKFGQFSTQKHDFFLKFNILSKFFHVFYKSNIVPTIKKHLGCLKCNIVSWINCWVAWHWKCTHILNIVLCIKTSLYYVLQFVVNHVCKSNSNLSWQIR